MGRRRICSDADLSRAMVGVIRSDALHSSQDGWVPANALARYLKQPMPSVLAVVAGSFKNDSLFRAAVARRRFVDHVQAQTCETR